MLEIKLYKSPWKAIKLILLSLPFVILSLADILHYSNIGPVALNWFCLCFFGLGIPLGLFNLFDRRPEIIINKTGIFDRRTSTNFINWGEIKDAYLKDLRVSALSKQKFLCLVMEPNATILLKANKTLVKISESLGFQGISIALDPLKPINWDEFIALIKSMLHANNSVKQNLLLTSKL